MERNFENLRVWQEARAFVNDVYAMMQDCSKQRDYRPRSSDRDGIR